MNTNALRTTLAATLLLAAASAHAANFRSYLSSSGNDANPCTLAQPCRLLPAALAATLPGGEIWILDSANYNTASVAITQSVSILAQPGTIGSVVAVAGSPAITVSGSNLKVALRNLLIAPLVTSPGTGGIAITGGGHAITVENVAFDGIPVDGLVATGTSKVSVSDSTFRNIGHDAIGAFDGAHVDVVRTRIAHVGNFGIRATSTSSSTPAYATVTDTAITNVSNCAYFSLVTATGTAEVHLTRASATGCPGAGACVQGGPGATMSLNQVNFQRNQVGVFFTSPTSIANSYGNNAILNNAGGDVVNSTLTGVALR